MYIIDPGAGTAGPPIPGWNEPLDGTIVGGTVLIPEGGPRKRGVFALDGSSPLVLYALPGAVNPFVAEPAFGDVWVLDYGSTKVWRIKPSGTARRLSDGARTADSRARGRSKPMPVDA